MESINFFVPGIPAPGGSKRFVGIGKKTGRAILVDAAGERNKNWRTSVAIVAAGYMSGRPLLDGPLHVTFKFYVPRPKGHRKANGELRNGSLTYPTTRPDALKLARSTEDALTGVVWADDAQTVRLDIDKFYADFRPCGCEVTIKAMS